MRIAITGADGQLGKALCSQIAPHHEIVPLSQPTLELERPETLNRVAETGAHLVIHAAADTNVDGCAREPERAYRVNGLGTRYVALACQQLGAPLVYISTNEVFSGSQSTPYTEYEPPQPINPYGFSKWAGEQVVRELLPRFYIVRIAWLFGGARNFVRTVLRLAANPPEGGLRIVADEVGSPTYTADVADALLQLIEQPYYGTYHLVNQGACSRYEFAQEILRLAGHRISESATHDSSDISPEPIQLTPIKLADYQRDSTPPPFTPLANIAGAALGVELRPWQEALQEYLRHLESIPL